MEKKKANTNALEIVQSELTFGDLIGEGGYGKVYRYLFSWCFIFHTEELGKEIL